MRKADKFNVFVVIDGEDCFHKLDETLSNTHKFSVVTFNTTAPLKTEVNKLIKSANQQSGQTILKLIVEDFKPGYIYGTVKTHKNWVSIASHHLSDPDPYIRNRQSNKPTHIPIFAPKVPK